MCSCFEFPKRCFVGGEVGLITNETIGVVECGMWWE
jgi:hypothetical protein